MESLKGTIEDLISLKQEGGYWDFKREWYKSRSALLHDIICMSNNLDNRDAYIIIGIDEENDYKITDVSNDENRRNTQKIVDFLKDKKFAGDIRPIVYVESIELFSGTIDVIFIQNSSATPFYLKEKYEEVCSNHIYTRVQDTNTPIKSSADIDKVEWLWEKRFGLIETPIERMETFLSHPDDWIDGSSIEMQKYHKKFPEYTMTVSSASDNRDGYEFYLFTQSDPTPHWNDIKFFYHQTLLMEIDGAFLDGGRYVTSCPEPGGITLSDNIGWDVSYKYMIKDSFRYKLHEFLYENQRTEEADIARDRFLRVILIFENKSEKKLFDRYISENWDDREKFEGSFNVPSIPQIEGYVKDVLKEKYKNALILQRMLEHFRKCQQG